jgi:predicted nucleic acid-binding protein
MFLLDTVILSETRKRHHDPGVVAWLSQQRDADLYLSVVTIGEIERGIAQQQTRNPDFAQTLSQWLDRVLTLYDDRILPVDTATARRWGELSAAHGNNGADLLIAASALTRGLTVVTRNERHFRPTGVDVCNPFVEG